MIYTATKGQDVYGVPVGIVVMDCLIPYPPGTPGNATTFGFPVMYATVRGADMENLIYDPKPELTEKFVAAGEELVRQGAKAIFGNCGFMVFFQEAMANALPVPVFMSSLLQLPLIRHGLRQGEKVGILTASGTSLTPRHLEIATGGAAVEIVSRGLEHGPAFKAAIHDQVGTLDFEAVEAEVVAAALTLVDENPDVGAILLECTDLPPYAAAVQEATGLPVFDVTSLINYGAGSVLHERFPQKQG
ncbi:MAG: aspartate/glutamate racemase family protein [Marivita sp.]|uniref:aspartate/glutamate racemase family protein n=1 Tax=Marivita sp. TaxID=2003365 RepID=UPI0025C1C4DE|nr:aspartate/glutamate racemase family protein [Marivita sp.]MCI5109686.1 aspartate/glutamate racemase family protein [Marivita sp.]